MKATVNHDRLFADVPEADLLMTIRNSGEYGWAADRFVKPATGYDERMNTPQLAP